MMRSHYKASSVLLVLSFAFSTSYSQTTHFTSVPPGYRAGSIQLPRAFTGALGVDPTDENTLFVSVGAYLDTDIARVDLKTGSAAIVAEGPFGSVGGIAVLSATEIVLTDGADVEGPPPGRTILLASDKNGDGDFDNEGEVAELIPPILTGDFGWTGAQVRAVPPGNPSGIPAGSAIVQTADGGGEGELLVVRDPLGTPAYLPENAAFFGGFDYNGGFDVDSRGYLMLGTATIVDATFFDFDGRVIALVNTNGDEEIDEGEFHAIVGFEGLPNSISDLTVDGEDDVFCTSGGEVLTFPVPNNPLVETATPVSFAETDFFFLSGVLVNSKEKAFEPYAGPDGATMILGGFGGNNLLTLTPNTSADMNGDGTIDGTDLILFREQWHREMSR